MDYRDREQIDRCCNYISPIINMCHLWPQLLETQVFMDDDVNIPTWINSLDKEDTARDILDTIKTRGPHAFKNLVRSLRKTSQDHVADILEGKVPLASNDNVQNGHSKPFNNAVSHSNTEDGWYYNTKFVTTEEPLIINVKRATKFMDEMDETILGKYTMRRKPHGYVLIITIKAYIAAPVRRAAEHDQANLTKLFEDMGFEVTVPDPETALTGAEINRIVKEFSKRDFHKVDSCFVIISAHGNEVENKGALETEIHGIDYNTPGAEKVLCNDLVKMFTAENCKHLTEKPKVFIFQACRGDAEQKTIRYAEDGSFASDGKTRNYSDILIAHSTMSGHKAYRDQYNGSWYIQILCEVFMNYACTMHIHDLFNKVDGILKTIRTADGRAQTSTVKSMGFSKHLYLNPGIFEES